MKNKEIKQIKERLMNRKVFFTIKGHTEYGKLKNGKIVMKNKVFHTLKTYEDEPSMAIYDRLGNGMNIEKWGTKVIHLYGYDILKNRTAAAVMYEDIKLIKNQ